MEPTEIPSVLACDVGNSAIHFAHVRGEEVTEVQTVRVGELTTLGEKLAALWEQIPAPRKIAAGSVNPPAMKALEAAVSQALGEAVLVIGRDLPLPAETHLRTPETIGVDRLCCAAAAYDRLGRSCVVADVGTAITVDCVDDEGIFLGGAILPGLRTAAASLSEHTAQLPAVEPIDPDWVFGRDTREAIVSGLVHGARGALRALVETYATELGHWPVVIVTGGDAALLCPETGESDLVQAIVPDLAVRGVAMSYYKSLLK